MQLMDMNGCPCGNFDGDPPEGFWTRPDDAPLQLSRAEFFDRIGAERFLAIWHAVIAQPDALAFTFFRGFAVGAIDVTESFPRLLELEVAGVLPAGSAIAIWSEVKP